MKKAKRPTYIDYSLSGLILNRIKQLTINNLHTKTNAFANPNVQYLLQIYKKTSNFTETKALTNKCR